LNFENIWHFVPKYFEVVVGNGPYYPGFNGELKGVKFSAGNGSYRDGDFGALVNEEVDECKTG